MNSTVNAGSLSGKENKQVSLKNKLIYNKQTLIYGQLLRVQQDNFDENELLSTTFK